MFLSSAKFSKWSQYVSPFAHKFHLVVKKIIVWNYKLKKVNSKIQSKKQY